MCYFSVPIKKEHNNKTITYKLKFVDTCRFMPTKLSGLVDNLSKINDKNCKTCLERKNVKSECEFIGLKNNRWITDVKNAREYLLSQ